MLFWLREAMQPFAIVRVAPDFDHCREGNGGKSSEMKQIIKNEGPSAGISQSPVSVGSSGLNG